VLRPRTSTVATDALATTVITDPVVATPADRAVLAPADRAAPRAAREALTAPRVHIGRVDVVVVAPPVERPAAPAAPANLASRMYLRGL
jgi:hypothetical protein